MDWPKKENEETKEPEREKFGFPPKPIANVLKALEMTWRLVLCHTLL